MTSSPPDDRDDAGRHSAPGMVDRKPEGASPRGLLRVVAVALLILTAVLGFASFSTSDGVGCGSLIWQSSDPAFEDAANDLDESNGETDALSPPADNRVECERAFTSQKPYVFGALGVAILTGVVSQIVRPRSDG